MSDAESQTEDNVRPPSDPDDTTALEKTGGMIPAAGSPPSAPVQDAAPAAPTTKQQSFSEFMGPAEKPQNFTDFMKEPNLLQNIEASMLPLPSRFVPGAEMTDVQRSVLMNQQIGHVFDAFGQNFSHYMEDNAAHSEMFKEGMAPTDFKNYVHQEDILNKGWYDGLVVPGMKTFASLIAHDADVLSSPIKTTLPVLYHTPGSLFAGLFGEGGPVSPPGAVEQAGVELGMPELGRTLAEAPIALGGEGSLGPFTGFKENAIDTAVRRHLLEPITSNVIGRGITEENYFGTVPLTAEQQKAVDNAAAAMPPEAEQPDIHAIARQIAPEAFGPYDQTLRMKNHLSDVLAGIQEARKADTTDLLLKAPHTEEIADLKSKIADPDSGLSARNLKLAKEKLEDLSEKNDTWIADRLKEDTPKVAELRGQIQKLHEQLADIAHTGKIAEAYRKAHDQMPVETAPEVVEHVTPETSTPATPPKGLGTEPVPESDLAGMQKQESTENNPATRVAFIAGDVAKKLLAAGRPEEEATTAGQLVAARYEAAAAQGWTKGNSLDIYRRHMAEIEGKNKVQKTKGRLNIPIENAKNTIILAKNADASTFIHEVGHHWLEEMMDWASGKDAPQDLKDHASAIRDWLGIKNEGDAIKTAQHERFARGFETYIMEGRAPTAALARVFEQLKQWMADIYGTLTRLKSPINDKVRNVFDHMLSANPDKRTIITPDAEPSGTLARMHETDAVTTPPERAAEAADVIEKEIDQTARQHKPEIADGIKSPETGGLEGEAPVLAEAGTAAEPPVPGGSGGAAEPATVAGSGAGAAPQGGPARSAAPAAESRPRGSASQGSRRAEPERGVSGEAERDKYIGNINANRANIIASGSFEQAIREAAGKNSDFIEQRRGKMTVGQIIDLADKLGKDPAFLSRKKIGEAFSAEEIVCIDGLLKKAHESMEEARTSFLQADEEGKAEAGKKYAEEISWFEYIQGKASQAAAEAGRAQFAHSMLVKAGPEVENMSEFLKQNTGRNLYQLEEIAKAAGNLSPEQKASLINSTAAGKLKHAVLYYYINSLLSGPFTHTRYLIGNEFKMLYRPLVETPIAATIGAAREAITGKSSADRVYFREIPAQLAAIWDGHIDGSYAAMDALKSGVSAPLPGEEARPNNLMSGTPVFGNGAGVSNAVIKGYGAPQRVVAAIHSLNKATAYTQNIYSQATRIALREGHYGDALSNRIAQLRQHPTQEMMESASGEALQRMYMAQSDYDSSLAMLGRAVNNNLMAKMIIPFLKVGSEITKEAFVQGTPLGLLSREVRENIAAGGARRDMQIARMTAGTGVMMTGVKLTASGRMTGDGPSDPKARAEWLLTHRPNSIKIGESWYPYQGLGSIGMAMRFAANATETAAALGHEDLEKVIYSGIEGVSKSVIDDNFMRGMKDFLDAVYHPEQYGTQYVKGFAGNFIPWSVGLGQTARAIDPDMREAHSMMEEARKHIPFLSERLEPKVDRFGAIIPQTGSTEIYKNDPTVQELDRIGFSPSKVEPRIRGVALNSKQYFEFSTIAGKNVKTRLDNLIGQSSYQQWDIAHKVERINQVVKKSREDARRVMLMNYPEIAKQAHALKTAR